MLVRLYGALTEPGRRGCYEADKGRQARAYIPAIHEYAWARWGSVWILENEGRVVCRQKSTRVGGLETVGMETAGAGRPGEDNQRNAWIIGKSREFTRDTGLSASAQGN